MAPDTDANESESLPDYVSVEGRDESDMTAYSVWSTVYDAIGQMLPRVGRIQNGNTFRHEHDLEENDGRVTHINLTGFGRTHDVYARVELDRPLELSNTKSLHGVHGLKEEEPTLYNVDPDPDIESDAFDMVVSIGFTSQTINYGVDIWMPVEAE